MVRADGIGTVAAKLKAWVKSPKGKLNLAKSGVNAMRTCLRMAVQGFIGQNTQRLWKELYDFQEAVARLKEEAKNFIEATGKAVPSEIVALIAEAEKDIQYYRGEIPKLPEKSRQLMAMVFTI